MVSPIPWPQRSPASQRQPVMTCALLSSLDLLLGERYEKGTDARDHRKGYRDPLLGLGPFFYSRPRFLLAIVVVEIVRMTVSILMKQEKWGRLGRFRQ